MPKKNKLKGIGITKKEAEDLFSPENMNELLNEFIKIKSTELRKSNMAFDELLSRVPASTIREICYELKERKISEKNLTDSVCTTTLSN